MVFGKEVGECGTKHLQGYVYWETQRSFNVVKGLLGGNRYHIERARGTPEQNRAYCTKDNDFTEFGTIPEQGRRTDLEDAARLLRDTGRLDEVADHFPSTYIRYERGLRAFGQRTIKHRSTKPWVCWVMGQPGAGKSRLARTCPGDQYWAQADGQWWDHYEQQEVVIVDDVCVTFPTTLFKKLCDWYPLMVPYKGGFAKFTSPIVIFTCVISPTDRFEYDAKEPIEQITRRIDCVFDVDKHFDGFCDSFDPVEFWKQLQEN